MGRPLSSNPGATTTISISRQLAEKLTAIAADNPLRPSRGRLAEAMLWECVKKRGTAQRKAGRKPRRAAKR